MTNLLTPSNKKLLLSYIQTFLNHQPAFYSLIRPQEALLFHHHQQLIKAPILDFGCGDGFFTHTVFGHQSIDVGLDIDSSRIDQASKCDVYRQIITYDGIKIPFPDNHFQTIISNCVLEHLPQLTKNLKEIHRVLKPDGHFLTTVMTDQWEKHLIGTKIFGATYTNYLKRKQQHLNLYSLSQWQHTFTDSGFKIKDTFSYLNPPTSHLLELGHYFSLPSLLTYKLFHQLVLIKNWYRLFRLDLTINNQLNCDIDTATSDRSGTFFVLVK